MVTISKHVTTMTLRIAAATHFPPAKPAAIRKGEPQQLLNRAQA
jgi:hypothetical protein